MPVHIAIIGGGPSGAAAAAILAQAGLNVTLIEQHTFPRDKVCGECLSPTAWNVLSHLGLTDSLQSLGAIPLTRTLLHAPKSPTIDIPLPHLCFGLSRSAMDSLLLEHARKSGANILQPVRCENLISNPDHAALTLRNLVTNQLTTLTADYALLADGKSALLSDRPAQSGDLGVKAHFAKIAGPRDAVELFALDGHYAGLNPIEAGRSNLALAVPAHILKTLGGDLDQLFDDMLEYNPSLRKRMDNTRRIGPWLTCPLPRFPVNPTRWPDRILPIGNAAAALEPIGGEGMGLALRSAQLTADHAIQSISESRPLHFADLAGRMNRLWNTRRTACRAAALLLSRPALAGASLDLLSINPTIQNALLRLIGK